MLCDSMHFLYLVVYKLTERDLTPISETNKRETSIPILITKDKGRKLRMIKTKQRKTGGRYKH